MVRNSSLTECLRRAQVFRIDAPYANTIQVVEEHVVQELNPFAVFSHLTAIIHHGLSDSVSSRAIPVSTSAAGPKLRLPLGTTPDDWSDQPLPPQRKLKFVSRVRVAWVSERAAHDFGWCIRRVGALPLYFTDLERTLLDALRRPDLCGGVLEAFGAWRRARSDIDIDRLVHYAERFDNQILRQRVGYLIEALGLSHVALERWRERLLRGSSVRLIPSAAYSPHFSARWNLSLNVDEAAIALLRDAE